MKPRRALTGLLLVGLMALLGDAVAEARPVAVRVMGSTSLVALVDAVLPAYAARHPGVSVHVSAGGSVAGLHEVAAGHVEMGVSDVPPAWAGVPSRDLVQVALGVVPVVPIAHADTGVHEVSRRALAALLSGRVRNWKELGGRPEKVVVVTRGPGSGALVVMERSLLHGQAISNQAVVELSNGAVFRAVEATPGAIGFVEAGFLRPGVTALAVDGRAFDPARAAAWPFDAPAAIYYRRGAPGPVRDLARFVAASPDRQRFGVYRGDGDHGGATRQTRAFHRGDGRRGVGAGRHAGRAPRLVRLGHPVRAGPLRGGSRPAGPRL